VLRNRLLIASILISLVVYALKEGELFFFSLVAVLILLSGYEFYQLMRVAGYQPFAPVGLTLIAIFLLQAYVGADWTRHVLIAAIVMTLLVAVFRRSDRWLIDWALTFAGALYVGGLGMHFILMRGLPDGMAWGAMAAFSTFAMDTAAYTFGKRWGKHPFFPDVSPKKTWEGALGGWACALIAMLIMGWLYSQTNPQMNFWHSVALGLGIGVFGTFGDLAESVIKRQVGAKDSSNLLGAHGGILDRIDSLLFVAVFVYYYVKFVLGI
jgi:phosphatidate cytidylyltransferase